MSSRLHMASRVALAHLILILGIAALVAILIFWLWFPYPYYQLSGGTRLFVLFCAINIVCGPLLTLILFDPTKARWKWGLDLTLIVLLQVGAMAYGFYNIVQSRPVFLAFEGDRFRIVRAADVDLAQLDGIDGEFSRLSWTGPRLVGVKLLKPTDPGYVNSLTLAIQGLHPAFRPSRWVPYSMQKGDVIETLRPISSLSFDTDSNKLISDLVSKKILSPSEMGYVPLVQESITDWVVIVGRHDGAPKAYLNLDGW